MRSRARRLRDRTASGLRERSGLRGFRGFCDLRGFCGLRGFFGVARVGFLRVFGETFECERALLGGGPSFFTVATRRFFEGFAEDVSLFAGFFDLDRARFFALVGAGRVAFARFEIVFLAMRSSLHLRLLLPSLPPHHSSVRALRQLACGTLGMG